MPNQFSQNILFQIHNLDLLLSRVLDKELSFTLKITFSQYIILSLLENTPRINQKSICNKLGVSEAAISKQIKILFKKQFIQVLVPDHNKNHKIISLTESGLSTLKESWKIINHNTIEISKGLNLPNLQDSVILMNSRLQHKFKGYKSYLNKKD